MPNSLDAQIALAQRIFKFYFLTLGEMTGEDSALKAFIRTIQHAAELSFQDLKDGNYLRETLILIGMYGAKLDRHEVQNRIDELIRARGGDPDRT